MIKLMASFSVNCPFTFHYEKKAFHKPPQALARKRGRKTFEKATK
jgi:hypothetical protein